MQKKVAMLISGGVDSSVALSLLVQQGFQVEAFYLKIWLEDELTHLGECPWQTDLAFIREICERFEVPLNVISCQKDYYDKVVEYTIAEIKEGRTPNPDVMCNKQIKFGLFFDKIKLQDFDFVASGHYARTVKINSNIHLKIAKDRFKDQTYFLATLNQKQLAKLIFPLGEYTKTEVRELAEQLHLPNKDRKDSQGICFLGKFKFSDFLAHYIKNKPGDLVDYTTNEILGSHNGFWYYTIGQRQNIRLSGGPWYVIKKDPIKNLVYVTKNKNLLSAMFDQFSIKQIVSPNPQQLYTASDLYVKVRHGEEMTPCSVDKNNIVHLDKSDQGLASGQFAVFYKNDVSIGSAVIEVEYDKSK